MQSVPRHCHKTGYRAANIFDSKKSSMLPFRFMSVIFGNSIVIICAHNSIQNSRWERDRNEASMLSSVILVSRFCETEYKELRFQTVRDTNLNNFSERVSVPVTDVLFDVHSETLNLLQIRISMIFWYITLQFPANRHSWMLWVMGYDVCIIVNSQLPCKYAISTFNITVFLFHIKYEHHSSIHQITSVDSREKLSIYQSISFESYNWKWILFRCNYKN